jgi:hypothetical protein
VNAARGWSDGELNELGNMLVRGLSIEEIARLLRRDHGEVRDKVAEVAGLAACLLHHLGSGKGVEDRHVLPGKSRATGVRVIVGVLPTAFHRTGWRISRPPRSTAPAPLPGVGKDRDSTLAHPPTTDSTCLRGRSAIRAGGPAVSHGGVGDRPGGESSSRINPAR